MKILIDTNILLYKNADHQLPAHLQKLLQIISDLNYQVVVHPLSVKEIEEDNNIFNRHIVISKIGAYSQVVPRLTPVGDDSFFELVGKPVNKREQDDCHLLYCVYKNEVDYFLTDDEEILKKAAALNISEKVMNSKMALSHFQEQMQKKVRQGDGPIICFYKTGDHWHIGEKGGTIPLKDMAGFRFIHFLLSYKNKYIPAMTVHSQGRGGELPGEDEKNKKFHEGVTSNAKWLNAAESNLLIKRITELKEDLESNDLSINDRIKKEEELEKFEKEVPRIKQKRDNDPAVEKARINVTKSIKKALKTLHDIPTIARYLNESTINTGTTCIYKPVVNDEPTWILHSNEVV